MKWSNSPSRPSGIFLDDDIYNEDLANFLRTNITPVVLTKASKEVGPDIKDFGIGTLAAERDLLILTRNGSHFRGLARTCGGVVCITATRRPEVRRLVREVLATIDPGVLYKAYTSACVAEIVVFPSDGSPIIRHRLP